MDELIVRNNAGEEFKFSLDEEFRPNLNLKSKEELLGTVIMCKEDLNNIRTWIDNNYDNADE